MLEMAILETQIFKILWGSMPPDTPRKLAPSSFDGTPTPFQNPGYAPVLQVTNSREQSANLVKSPHCDITRKEVIVLESASTKG